MTEAELTVHWRKFLERLALVLILSVGLLHYAQKPPPSAPEPPSSAGTQASSGRPAHTEVFSAQPGAQLPPELLQQIQESPLPGLAEALAQAKASGKLEGARVGSVPLKQIMEEARQGQAGPGVEKALAEAMARGDLDRMTLHGKSLRSYLEQAHNLAAQADALSRQSQAAMAEASGFDPNSEDPAKVAAESIRMLTLPDPEARLHAVQTLCDLRYAVYAKDAIPYLEAAVRGDPDPEVQEFAKLALQKVRFCTTNAYCRNKWRRK